MAKERRVSVIEFVGNPPYGREFTHLREIAADNWEDLPLDKPLVWDRSNAFRIPLETRPDVTTEHIERLKANGGFKMHTEEVEIEEDAEETAEEEAEPKGDGEE